MKFQRRNGKAAKLTPSQVLEIRKRYEAGECSQGDLAREYRISIVQIGRIVRYEVWTELIPAANEQELLASAQRVMELQVALTREHGQAGNRMIDELKGLPDGTRDPLDE